MLSADFLFPHLHLGDLYFSFLKINVLYFFSSEDTSIKLTVVECADNSPPCN